MGETKTTIGTRITLVAALAVGLLTGCGAPAAAPAPKAVPAATALKTATPAVTRRLMAAQGTTIWGLRYRGDTAVHATETKYSSFHWGDESGRISNENRVYYQRVVSTFWRPDMDFTGGTPNEDLLHPDEAKFLYYVPEGRMLVLNAFVSPQEIKLNGFPLVGDRETAQDLSFVFGPGEIVHIEFAKRGTSYNMNPVPALKGILADPALLGGAVGGAAGVGVASAGK